MRKISFSPDAYNDYLNWLDTDRQKFLKITGLIREASRNPALGTGKPELLKNQLSGYWSRRIDEKNRLVYSANDAEIEIISCKFHYK
jgi:toxin YoeB